MCRGATSGKASRVLIILRDGYSQKLLESGQILAHGLCVAICDDRVCARVTDEADGALGTIVGARTGLHGTGEECRHGL